MAGGQPFRRNRPVDRVLLVPPPYRRFPGQRQLFGLPAASAGWREHCGMALAFNVWFRLLYWRFGYGGIAGVDWRGGRAVSLGREAGAGVVFADSLRKGPKPAGCAHPALRGVSCAYKGIDDIKCGVQKAELNGDVDSENNHGGWRKLPFGY